MQEILSALAEPNRRQIVELLRRKPRAVGEIADRLGLRQPQVSKHLRVLSEAGLVQVRPLAQQRIYRLRWWGPRADTTEVDQMDVRPGGKWRFINRTPDGTAHGFRGEYREIVPRERIVQTFEYEPMPGHVFVETATFTEHEGRTLLTIRSVAPSKEDRDGMIGSGMEKGLAETHDRFAELLVELRAARKPA